MSEAEILELLRAYAETSGMFLAKYVSFTFAYITVAYFVGRDLSGFQCIAVSALYIVSGTFVGSSAVAWGYAWHELKTRQPTLLDDVWLMKHFQWVEVLALFLVSLCLVSLYFLYDVRRNPFEERDFQSDDSAT